MSKAFLPPTRAFVRRRKKLDRVSYDEMIEFASTGAKVLEIRSVEFAKKYGVPVHVRSTFSDVEGTWLVEEDDSMSDVLVSGVACDKNEAKITLVRVPDQPGLAAQIFGPIADAHIVVDMIIQNASEDGTTDLTFTVPKADHQKALAIVEKSLPEVHAKGVRVDTDIAKVSVVGVGMRTHAGVAATMFQTLAREKINIQMISTSEIKISVVIDAKQSDQAVRALHRGLHHQLEEVMKDVLLYDTTLRDGCQAEDVSFTLEDKLRIAAKLDELGIDYIEGGYPGSNERDADFFKRVKKLKLKNAKVASFGTTMKVGIKPSQDFNLRVLLEADTPVVTLVGKTWDLHVRDDLAHQPKGQSGDHRRLHRLYEEAGRRSDLRRRAFLRWVQSQSRTTPSSA